MRKNSLFTSITVFVFLLSMNTISYGQIKKCFDCPNVTNTGVPFLRITPDARAGAMGDVGLSTLPDANSVYHNMSKVAFADQRLSLSATYSPWLKNIGVQDVYMAYLAGYNKLDELNGIGFSLRYFDLGLIQFTDQNGSEIGQGSPNEFEVSLGYARKLSERLALGVTGKFIYSDLASGQQVGDVQVNAGIAGAADLSMTYKTPIATSFKSDLTVGLGLSNLGSKISYTDQQSDFLPANIGLGVGYNMQLDEYSELAFSLELNKALTPSSQPKELETVDGKFVPNPKYVEGENGRPTYQTQSFFKAAINSFSDAPNGGREELNEITYGIGAEYWYDKQFAARLGYFYEHPTKGNRRYFTAGFGIKYNVFAMDLSYLFATSAVANNSSPLDKTLRFSLLFDFE